MSHLGKSFASTLQKCINVQHLIDPRRFGSSRVVLVELLFECLKTRTEAKEKDTMKVRERPALSAHPTLCSKSGFWLFLCQLMESSDPNPETLIEQHLTEDSYGIALCYVGIWGHSCEFFAKDTENIIQFKSSHFDHC